LTVGRFTVGQKTEDGETVDMGDGRAMMDEGGNVEFQRLDAGFRLRWINPPYGESDKPRCSCLVPHEWVDE
jgi:hypothetical protein